MKKYVEEECLPLYNFPGPDEPDARVARAKLLLDQHAYLFQNPEVCSFIFPFPIGFDGSSRFDVSSKIIAIQYINGY
jgi:hypothetical protein